MMPKPWESFRAEIERLYIEENLTLKEVRRILSEKGFDASYAGCHHPMLKLTAYRTRAYQMKFDEWGLHKYGQNRDPRVREKFARISPLPDRDTSEESSPSLENHMEDSSLIIAGIALPEGDMDVSDLLKTLEAQQPLLDIETTIEIMVTKWMPDGKYLNFALSALRGKSAPFEIAYRTHNTTLFKLIENHVTAEDRFSLVKACLEADLASPISDLNSTIMWKSFWRAASHSKTWKAAKSLLYEGCQEPELLGKTFFHAGMVVIAERLLKGYMIRLEQLRAKLEPVTASDLDEATGLRKQYMEVLVDFRQTDFIPGVLWYKYSLIVAEWDAAVAAENIYKESNNEINDEYKAKYQQLKEFCSSFEGGVDHIIENLVLTANVLKKTKSIVQPQLEFGFHDPNNLHLSFVGRMGLDQIADDQPPVFTSSPSDVLESMLRNYRSGTFLQERTINLVQEDGEEISLFQTSRKGGDNLFDIIQKSVSPSEVQPFMRALLVSLGSEFHRAPSFAWWKSVYFSTRWVDLEALVTPDEVSLHLGTKMSPDAVKLVMDSTILHAGERLIAVLKRELDREEENILELGSDLTKYKELQREYMAILKTFRNRKLQTDQASFEYLLETFERSNLLP